LTSSRVESFSQYLEFINSFIDSRYAGGRSFTTSGFFPGIEIKSFPHSTEATLYAPVYGIKISFFGRDFVHHTVVHESAILPSFTAFKV